MITAPIWWAYLILCPLVYWVIPLRFRAPFLAVAGFALLLNFAGLDLVVMAILAILVFWGQKLRQSADPKAQGFGRLISSPWPFGLILIYFLITKYLPSLMAVLGHQESVFNLLVPLGVSYFSFRLLHYAIDGQRGVLPEHGFWDFMSYLFLAPIFTAGPIERIDHYLENRADTFEWEFVAEGLLRIAQGLVKKFIFAVLVLELLERYSGGSFADLVANLEETSPLTIWICLFLALAFSYLDFSAYSDIAIGSSRLFGLRIAENFNMPFLALSLQKFWQRWHMTLAGWVLHYVYMPLVGQTRNPYISIIVTFAVVGVWHAALPLHWLFWGLWHGIGLAILIWWTQQFRKRRSKFLSKWPVRAAGWVITMFYVAASEAFPSLYDVASLGDSFRLLGRAVGLPV